MWKFFSRGIRETFERRLAFTRKDTTSGQECSPAAFQYKFIPCVVSAHTFDSGAAEKCKNGPCNEKKHRDKEHQGERWRERCQLEQFTLFGLLGWSGAMLAGWYVFQPACRRRRRHCHQRMRPDLGCLKNHAALARCHTQYVSLWSLLSRTVAAQPLSILPKKPAETFAAQPLKILTKQPVEMFAECQGTTEPSNPFVLLLTDEADGPESRTSFGPKTAEQALDEAAADLEAAQKVVMGEVEHSIGMACMQLGKNKEALSHFQKAAELDYTPAVFNLGLCYELGVGTTQNLRLAAKYYELASKRGHATAMYNLGVFHVHGMGGVPVDSNRARELFEAAAQLGQSNAKDALAMVSPQNQENQQTQVPKEETRADTPKAVADKSKLGNLKYKTPQKTLDATQALYRLLGIKNSNRNEEDPNATNHAILQTRELTPVPLVC